MKLKADVKGHHATIQRIRDGISDGMEDAAEELLDKAEEDAQDVLSNTRRIWKREVYHGFDKEVNSYKIQTSARLANYAPHATVVERGADYGARGPPVQALIPWVISHGGGFSAGSDDSDDGGSDSPSGGRDTNDTDVTGDDFPDRSIGGFGDGPEDLEQHGAKPDWQFYDAVGHFEPDDTFTGRNVVLFNRQDGGYYSATVDEVIDSNTITIDVDGDKQYTIDSSQYTNSDWSVVGGEDFDNLSESTQEAIIDETFDNIPRDSQFNQITKDQINRVIGEYRDLLPDRDNILTMAHGIKRIDLTTDKPSVRNVGNGNVIVNLHATGEPDPTKRDNQFGLRTTRHEFAHALLMTHGYNYQNATRSDTVGNSEWDMVETWSNNFGKVDWDWVEQGIENWHFDDSIEDYPHPIAYFLTKDSDKPTSPTDLADYDPWEKWGQYVYRDSVISGDAPEGKPQFNHRQYPETDILHPQTGDAEEGGYLKLMHTDQMGSPSELDVRVLSGVKEYEPEDLPSNINSRGWGIEIDWKGDSHIIPVNDDGTLGDISGSNDLDYLDYDYPDQLSNAGWDFDETDVGSDPGFFNDADSLDGFVEGVNRSFLRQAIASEVWDEVDYNKAQIRREYNVTNSHENLAAFMPVLMGSTDDGKPSLNNLDDLMDDHPDLLWAAIQNFNVPQEFKDKITSQTNLTWDEIIMDLDPNFQVP